MKLDDELKTRLNAEVVRAHYTYDRYNAESTFALVYHEEDIPLDKLGSFVRVSDRLVRVSDKMHFVIFNFTPQNDAYKASRNLLKSLDNHFHNTTSCIAIDAPSKTDTIHMVMNKLYQILQETRKNSVARIEYADILDTTF